MRVLIIICSIAFLASCSPKEKKETPVATLPDTTRITPTIVTDTVSYDSDDPAIWINPQDPSQSLIIGTDKGGDTGDGGLYVFDLSGKLIADKTVKKIQRPNNVDIAYGVLIKGVKTDIAVCTERNTNSIRAFSLPDMKPVDGGGIPVFEGVAERAPMGIALYTSPDNKTYAIVGRKTGPSGSYLWQYLLEDNGRGQLKATVVRKFASYSGKNEIEAIAVDNELGYVYCSDESVGVRKYYAHPDSTNTELALFATSGFTDNHEGISIYKSDSTTGYILVSDQQANQFHVFPREGVAGNAHDHPLIKVVRLSTIESDGSDVTNYALPGFPNGFFVAMSDDKTFQIYRWEDVELKIRN